MQSINLTCTVDLKTAAGKVPVVKILAYRGDMSRVPEWGNLVIDLDGMELGETLPLLNDHQNSIDSIAGSGKAGIVGDALYVVGQLAVGTPGGDKILALHKGGVSLQASVGSEPTEYRHLASGEEIHVNNRTITVPRGGMTLVEKCVLRECSFVPVGANVGTEVSIAASAKMKTDRFADLRTFAAEVANIDGAEFDNLPAGELARLNALSHGRMTATEADRAAILPFLALSADPVRREEVRLHQIENACRGDWGESFTLRIDDLKASAIGGDLTVDELIANLRAVRLEKLRGERMKMGTITSHSAGRQPDGRIIEASFAIKGGLSHLERHYDARTLEQAHPLARNASLQSLIMSAAIGAGYSARPAEGITQANLRSVLEYAFQPSLRASAFSTVSLPGILSNIASKYLEDGFIETSGDEWTKISELKSVDNFKEAKFYRLLESAEYELLPSSGELKHGKFGESVMTAKVDTYGRLYQISRQHLIDDDTSALSDIPRRLGRAAGQKFRRLFWAAFLAGDGFWAGGNGNVLTGASTALDINGLALERALAAFRAMRTSVADGKKLLGGKPAVLMVPPALEIVGRRLMSSTGIVAGGALDASLAPSGNPYQNLAELVVVDWLSDTDLTGYSAAKWYLLRSPSLAPAMLAAFLGGQRFPTVQSSDADFNLLGIQMRGYHDFGVGRGEPLCGLQVEGLPAS